MHGGFENVLRDAGALPSGIGATVWCIEGYHYCYNN